MNLEMMSPGELFVQYFMGGGAMLACAACGLIFLRSWKNTADRLFLLFALAFFFMSLERWVLVSVSPENEFRFYVYTIRMISFVLIAIAIVEKNRKAQR
jgi:hypothetical protein